MGSTTTQTSIANRALQLVGYQPISSLQENSRGARAMNRAYQPCLLATLRSNFWSFAIKRAILAASSTAPSFGKANYFPLPNDFVMLAPPDQYCSYNWGTIPIPNYPNTSMQYNDWQIENMGGVLAIATDEPAPLYIRFISSDITEAMFDSSFAEAFSANLAIETCEELTQSNTKLTALAQMYKDTMELAKKRNAFEKQPTTPPVDAWILVRR